MRIYKINEEYRKKIEELEQLIDSDDQAAIEQAVKALDANNTLFEDRIEAYAYIIQEKKAQEDALKKEADRILKMKKSAETTSNFLKSVILQAMKARGVKKLEFDFIKVREQPNPDKLVIDEIMLPDTYWKEETVRKPDTGKIKEALAEDDKSVLGAKLVKGSHIRVW